MEHNREQELLFAQTLEQIRKEAVANGNTITSQEIREAFAAQDLTQDQFQLIYDYIRSKKIGIDEAAPENTDGEEALTEEEKDYLQDYLDEIAELKTLTEGEKRALSMSAMNGEKDAQNRLIEGHLKDVVDMAKLYAGQGVYLEDLIGEGNTALAMAVTNLGALEDPDEVSGTIGKMIMDAMERLIRETFDSSRTGNKVADQVNAVADKAKELAEAYGRKVTPAELAQATDLSVEEIEEAVLLSGFKIEDIEVGGR
ncbi:MAG: hypothetical protein K5682_04790 [Lachnospiraceae bacterium]|nr:hypothetical protein [Lachnospiraceae bacterium]